MSHGLPQREFRELHVRDHEQFKLKILGMSRRYRHFCLLESNNYPHYPHSNFGSFAAIEALEIFRPDKDCLASLQRFHDLHADWMFGYLSYDLKNEIEPSLTSSNPDGLGFSLMEFFIPKYLVMITGEKVELGVVCDEHRDEFLQLLEETPALEEDFAENGHTLKRRLSRQEYIERVNVIKDHIQRGDIYETNFCQEFFIENISLPAESVFNNLNHIARAPFCAFYKSTDQYLLCSSPERYLKKTGRHVVSQPIKGTARRGADEAEDKALREALGKDPKELSENIMIVDLVRNDLAKVAVKGTVHAEELCRIYTFETVHQMISTIAGEVEQDVPFTEILRATFPMGSMTGAPKYRAMQIIDEMETRARGLYSGAVGYVSPKGNFDFNVVIRSILYNARDRYASIQVGSAITIDCEAEKEYAECVVKASGMLKALHLQPIS